ncbi:hypothetical protein [Halolamina salifodinae]|uniref:Uncharacterized protein n=1 Tax=Halolamina salifodinae TaxID=1202767 RepID=A0A8T4GXK4_9EURY|nr:hypothetical protein [Halolamina salifodinae]MBP1986035.1 hypothetical protein [Halolamina salifodinae]
MGKTIEIVAYTVSGEPSPMIRVFETADAADEYIQELNRREELTEVERRAVDVDDLD